MYTKLKSQRYIALLITSCLLIVLLKFDSVQAQNIAPQFQDEVIVLHGWNMVISIKIAYSTI